MNLDILAVGALAFGLLVGWCASLAIKGEKSFGIKQLGTLIGVVAGSALVALFGKAMLAWYFLGLVPAFFVNRFVSMPEVQRAMSNAIKTSAQTSAKSEESGK